MSKQPTVADYIVQRLAREGITDCFGVAGDFAFKLDDAVARSEAIRWIGCSNELDAAYAADGYARVRGCSMLLTTYAVGELSALNGVMGAKAERSCVFHLVGMPTMRKQRVRQIVHHTLGDGEFQNFANISAQAACVSAVITPDNCAHEMERLIATARAESRPAYILVASDYAVTPVTGRRRPRIRSPPAAPTWPRPSRRSPSGFRPPDRVAVLPAYTVSRFKLQDRLRALIETLGCPFAAMAMDKGVLSETHPQFVGTYSGAGSSSRRPRGSRRCRPGHRRWRRQFQRDQHGRLLEPASTPRSSSPSGWITSASGTGSITPSGWAMSLTCWPGRSEELRILGAAPAGSGETGRQAERPDHRGGTCIPVIETF